MTDFEANRRHWKRLSWANRLALVFGVCADSIRRTGSAPTLEALRHEAGLKSRSQIQIYIKVLVSWGFLKRDEQGLLVFGDDCYLKTNAIPFHIAPVKIST